MRKGGLRMSGSAPVATRGTRGIARVRQAKRGEGEGGAKWKPEQMPTEWNGIPCTDLALAVQVGNLTGVWCTLRETPWSRIFKVEVSSDERFHS
jgi:hypothetical protein